MSRKVRWLLRCCKVNVQCKDERHAFQSSVSVNEPTSGSSFGQSAKRRSLGRYFMQMLRHARANCALQPSNDTEYFS